MTVILNQAPAVESFCAAAEPPSIPLIRFPGGFVLEPQVDPTRGVPGNCALVLDLTGKLQGALAPFTPFFRVLDFVAHLAQCFLLMKDAITNPFKIPDLIACLPGLLGKLNQLLALIPVFPQGIAGMLTFVVDVLRFVIAMLDCVISQLRALQAELVELARLTEILNATEDDLARTNLETMIRCGTEQVEQNAATILAALGPIARLLCTVRTLLSIVPGGSSIASAMRFPDPSQISKLSDAIQALEALRGVLDAAASTVEGLGAPFGLPLEAPGLGFTCPLDSAAEEETTELPATPEILLVQNLAGAVLPPTTIPRASPGDPDTRVFLSGTGYSATSQVYWNTVRVEGVQRIDPTRLLVDLPAELLTNTGNFYLMVVNTSTSTPAAFSGLSETPGVAVEDSGVKMSEQYEVEVS